MARQRAIEIERLVSNMDETRDAIARTVGELTDRVRETVDWREQALRHPAASLGAAALLGFMLGKALSPIVRLAIILPRKAVARPALGAPLPAGFLGRLVAAGGLASELALVRSLVAHLLASFIRTRHHHQR
jgi:hypothetical protein